MFPKSLMRQLRILRNRPLLNLRYFSDNSSTTPSQSSNPTIIANKLDNHSPPSSLNHLELAKFSAIANTWFVFQVFSSYSFQFLPFLIILVCYYAMSRWDSQGPFKPLHAMNPTRLAFIRSTLCRHFRYIFCFWCF